MPQKADEVANQSEETKFDEANLKIKRLEDKENYCLIKSFT